MLEYFLISRNMVCSMWTAKTCRNKVSISALVLFLCCTCNLFLCYTWFLTEYRLEIFFTKCVLLNGHTTIFIELSKLSAAVKYLMQPSLCRVDGSCVCDRVSWTKLTLRSKDGIDSLNPALQMYFHIQNQLKIVTNDIVTVGRPMTSRDIMGPNVPSVMTSRNIWQAVSPFIMGRF